MGEWLMTAGGLKQRLVGALVLICAGVVLWSLLFTGPKVREIDRQSQIPTPPEKVVVNVPDPQPRNGEAVNTDLNSEPTVAIPTPAAAATAAVNVNPAASKNPPVAVEPTPALPEQATVRQDARGIPIAWVVVVGSFADQTKANGIVTDLKKRGFKAYADVLKREGRTLYRVSVGPKLEKSQAEKIKQDIDALMKVNASVLKFELPR
jgi:DedD protein